MSSVLPICPLLTESTRATQSLDIISATQNLTVSADQVLLRVPSIKIPNDSHVKYCGNIGFRHTCHFCCTHSCQHPLQGNRIPTPRQKPGFNKLTSIYPHSCLSILDDHSFLNNRAALSSRSLSKPAKNPSTHYDAYQPFIFCYISSFLYSVE